MTVLRTLGLVTMLVAAGACCRTGGASSEGTAPEHDKSGKSPEKTGAAAPGQKYLGPGNVPDVPETTSAPPTVAEWGAAAEVNTVGANSAPRGCSMHVVREWLKVNCSGKIQSVSDMEGFGKKGVDYFELVTPPNVADFVVRMKRGGALKLRIHRDDDRASLFMSWPQGSSKPSIIALQQGPKG
jgi:hypothetical protein